jgi:hypothetical protein
MLAAGASAAYVWVSYSEFFSASQYNLNITYLTSHWVYWPANVVGCGQDVENLSQWRALKDLGFKNNWITQNNKMPFVTTGGKWSLIFAATWHTPGPVLWIT